MSNSLEGLSVDQLQHLLAEHMEHRPADLLSKAGLNWIDLKGKIKFHLDLAEGSARSAWVPAPGPSHADPAPVDEFRLPEPSGPVRKPAPLDFQDEDDELPDALAPLAPAAVEAPVSQAPQPQPPKVNALHDLLQQLDRAVKACLMASEESAFLVARQKFYTVRLNILKLVKAQKLKGSEAPTLPLPPVNRFARTKKPTPLRANPVHEKAQEPVGQVQEKSPASASRTTSMDQLAESLLQTSDAVSDSLRRALGMHYPSLKEDPPDLPANDLPGVAAKFRALRTQAIELLPYCEDLTPEGAQAVRHQIDLLAGVLAMGDRLAQEALEVSCASTHA